MATLLVPLIRVERVRLVELESLISQALELLQERAAAVGAWLREIRDQRLYRETHATWTDYLRSRSHWTFGRARAYQLLAYAEVLTDVSTMGGRLPTERESRELHKLPAEERGPAWEAVAVVEAALAALPPEEQQQQIAAAEQRGLAAPESPDPHAAVRMQAVKLIARLRTILAKLGKDGSGALRRLERVSVAILALPAEV